ncbi:sulfoxide reductase heme-binding subunit YedZ [Pseudothauera nasutitermitis]|uniref:Protein-methionine-sulfoxide reductase heme-binding subunit MsrQ n=1 Tax=Pseudothauera nasutitermitis TaxID=2565930 RepID=A0A4S4ARD5_9RHOO|nr:protein-methionine-sulfoxide reductase heme-binding subunit MsrQ [Pseudothauera nasutitermitis]THF62322.1 sulfoxide reductase heme-binding subunit YedZ [Pseudothauera nasutitermitis]
MNPPTPSPVQLAAIKTAVFLLCLLPAVLLARGWFANALGANPVEAVQHATGSWALNMLLISLAVTPLRRLTGLHWLIRLRRMLGLFAFAWACAHLLNWIWLDLWFDWRAIGADILDRPYVSVGFAAFVLMLPLAATSTQSAMRRLGGRRWQALHRSAYVVAILGVAHFWWLVKADVLEPLLYALALAALLGARMWQRELERRRQLAAPPPLPGTPPKGRVIRIVPK